VLIIENGTVDEMEYAREESNLIFWRLKADGND
jgi:hypothetical protein